jgi:hypothetical protein
MLFRIILLISTYVSICRAAEDSVGKWAEIASKSRSNVIRLDEHSFDQLITTDRNYTAIGSNSMLLFRNADS